MALDTKEGAVERGMQIFERIEEGCDKLVQVWNAGHSLGMMSKNELDHLTADTLALKHHFLALHCRGTAIAQREGVDVPVIAGGGGGR